MIRFYSFFVGLLAFGSFPNFSSGQSTRPIPLNKHYFEIHAEDTLHHAFNLLISYTADSTKIERIFNLDNQIARIKKTTPRVEDYQELTLEEFDSTGQLFAKTTANLINGKFITSYFREGEQIAQVMYRGEHKYTIHRKGYESPKQTLENNFEPRPNEQKSDFSFFLGQRTKFGQGEWPAIRHHVVIGVFVDESGTVREVIWANPLGAEKRVADKYLKALQAWKKGFHPALDVYGNPISAWKYYHFHPGGRLENAHMVIKFNQP